MSVFAKFKNSKVSPEIIFEQNLDHIPRSGDRVLIKEKMYSVTSVVWDYIDWQVQKRGEEEPQEWFKSTVCIHLGAP